MPITLSEAILVNLDLTVAHFSRESHNKDVSFVDKAEIIVHAGDGGDGVTSFRREKFVAHGGPDGGDGGDGGSVILYASRNQNTLANFRYQKELQAVSGNPGSKRRRHGKNGVDLRVAVPVGTIAADGQGVVRADLELDGQEVIIAKGGKGGYGNAHFVSSTRQAPRVSEKGEKGELFEIALELKMIADVGLVGLPNAGKSTLLSIISNAQPEIADYPFTTLTPNLGVVDVDKARSLLFADIPGLIEGAAKGKGLGDEFLRHVERTVVLVHLIDAYQEDIVGAYHIVQDELRAYKIDLSSRPQLVVLTKIEGLDKEMVADLQKRIKAVLPKNTQVLAISAKSGQGIPIFLRRVVALIDNIRSKNVAAEGYSTDDIPVIKLSNDDTGWRVVKEKNYFIVNGRKIERFAVRTDFANDAGIERLRDIMKKMGIMHELDRQGAVAGNRIVIGNAGELVY